MEPFLNKEVEDTILIPISINYEKLVELDNHVAELLGDKKAKPSFNKFVQVVFGKVLGSSFGRIIVQVAQVKKYHIFMPFLVLFISFIFLFYLDIYFLTFIQLFPLS
jgi:hypothetical protein